MEIQTRFDGSMIGEQRAMLGISQDDLVFRMRSLGSRKVTKQTVGNWEHGTTTPAADFLPYLASVLECDVSAFFVSLSLTA